ncbi:hypothetical protein Tco_0512006 [Tanacetum coccineum]
MLDNWDNVWVKLSEGENIFTLTTDSYASNPTPIDCMERESHASRYDRVVPKGKYQRRVKTKYSRYASEQWQNRATEDVNRIPTLRRDLLGVARYPRWVEAKQLMAVKKTSFPEMEGSGSIVANVPGIVED